MLYIATERCNLDEENETIVFYDSSLIGIRHRVYGMVSSGTMLYAKCRGNFDFSKGNIYTRTSDWSLNYMLERRANWYPRLTAFRVRSFSLNCA